MCHGHPSHNERPEEGLSHAEGRRPSPAPCLHHACNITLFLLEAPPVLTRPHHEFCVEEIQGLVHVYELLLHKEAAYGEE